MYVLVRVGVVIVVLEDKVRAGYPADVEETVATHLPGSAPAQKSGLVQLYHVQPDIPVAENRSPQLKFVPGPVCEL